MTLEDDARRANEAFRELGRTMAETLRIRRLVEWLTERLEK